MNSPNKSLSCVEQFVFLLNKTFKYHSTTLMEAEHGCPLVANIANIFKNVAIFVNRSHDQLVELWPLDSWLLVRTRRRSKAMNK